MPVSHYFATPIYRAEIPKSVASGLNKELEAASLMLAREDNAGRTWSRAHNYPGYTSYASLNDLERRAPAFGKLRENLDAHVSKFTRALAFDLGRRKLECNSLWVNVMSPGASIHSGHIHPHSVLSGTYYVTVPKNAGKLKFEDPRLTMMMAAPPKKRSAGASHLPFIYIEPKAGTVLLWESWLRHEVVAGNAKSRRISISFNYA
ncbi:MAG: TIGR02466 family protein [Alphaproteobacteria bacterium]